MAQHVARSHTKACGCLWGAYRGVEAIANAVFNEGYADGDLTMEQFYKLSQLDCYYCGDPPSNHRKGQSNKNIVLHYNGLDRIDNSRGHYLDNVVTSCFPCNMRKRDWNQDRFLDWIENIYKRRCQNRNCQKDDQE